jgi:hypothetical protein
VYNVKAAVSRLEFGPEPDEMEVTDIATGHFVFRPVAGKEVSYAALDEAIEDAGYAIENAAITVAGMVTDERHVKTPDGQVFHVEAADASGKERLAGLKAGEKVVVAGAWKAVEGAEVVVARGIEAADDAAR